MICKQCGSRLRENNQCLKCGYDNHYYMEKLPKHLEQLDKFILEGAQKPVNQQTVVTARCSGSRQNSANADNRQNIQKPVNQQAVVIEQYSGNRQNSVNTYNQKKSGNSQTLAPPNRSGKGPFLIFGIIGIVCIAVIAVTFGFFVGRNHKILPVIVEQTQDTEMMSAETETDKSVESETQKTWASETGNTLESDMNENEESETSQQGNYGDGYAESGNGTGKEQNNRNGRNLPSSGTGGSGISEQYNTEIDTDTTAETDRLSY